MTETSIAEALKASVANPERFADVYAATSTRLLRFLTIRTSDAELGAELTAETFARALSRRNQFRGTTDAEAVAWLFSIGGRLHSNLIRRGKISKKAIERLKIEVPPTTDDDIAQIERLAELGSIRDGLEAAMATLSAPSQLAVRLRVIEELPYNEVAARLKTSEQNARMRVSRALRDIRMQIESTNSEVGP